MEFHAFNELLQRSLPVGLCLDNPSKGTSTVLNFNDGKVCYQRGGSRLYVRTQDLHKAYLHFKGANVTTKDLREYAPEIYDSGQKGHSCHCTFFFMALQRMNIVGAIWGKGGEGSPFGVTIPSHKL